jgi:hypothetical protein
MDTPFLSSGEEDCDVPIVTLVTRASQNPAYADTRTIRLSAIRRIVERDGRRAGRASTRT